MSQELFDVLKRRGEPAEMRKRLGVSIRELDARVLQLTASLNGTANLNGQEDSPEGQAIFSYVASRCRECGLEAERTSQPLVFPPELVELREWVRRRYFPDSSPVTAELLEWAQHEFSKYSEEELLAGIREIETTGGLELKDFIHELE